VNRAEQVELLDDLFVRAAAADEPLELNFIRKHSGAMTAQGLANSTARLFSNPAGDYGSMVNERVGAGGCPPYQCDSAGCTRNAIIR